MTGAAFPEHTALILVRAWVEPGSGLLKARVIGVTDLLSGEETSAAVSGVDDVCEVVRAWLSPLTVAASRLG